VALPPIGAGTFVLTNCPFGPPNRPDVPGPVPHIAYCLGFRADVVPIQLMLAHTNSGMSRRGTRQLPHGVIEFDETAARVLNQSPFHLDLRCLARVPLSRDWLPRLTDARHRHGIVAWAGPDLPRRINQLMIGVAKPSPDNIEIRGVPDR
jgi:hypothetical protein